MTFGNKSSQSAFTAAMYWAAVTMRVADADADGERLAEDDGACELDEEQAAAARQTAIAIAVMRP
jgi:hypothetical protein